MKRILFLCGAVSLCLLAFLQCTPKTQDKSFNTNLNENWQLFSSRDNNQTGSEISRPDFKPKDHFNINIPSTVLSGMIQNGLYPDVYHGGKLETIDREQFNCTWWYRKSFQLEAQAASQFHTLSFEGINYKANIWLNGELIADSNKVEGPFGIWSFDVSGKVLPGENVLAVEVFAPRWGDLTIGFVDWSPEAPDKNMGLWRGVYLKENGSVGVSNPHVVTTVNTQTLDEAFVSISATLKNHTNEKQISTFSAAFDKIKVSKKVELQPYEEKEIILTPSEFKQLHVKQPRLWWPNNMGEAHLYDMTITASVGKDICDNHKFRFGIRQIDTFRNDGDHLGFMVNGRKVLIKGGGWVDDMLLADTDEKVIAQVDYVKHMNMNTIRLEGFWGRNKTIYERCDEQGILLMIGWSCQWEWTSYCGRPEDAFMCIRDPKEQDQQARAFADQVLWLRNHPSIFLWNFGSDKLPPVELERLLHHYIHKVDTTRPLLGACSNRTSEFTGTTGVKMEGPYDWVSPNYWYIDKRFGGAYGFNTETGPGPQIPTLESIKRMIPEDQLWPRGELWNYHSGRFEFSTIDRFLKAFNKRYGEEKTLESFIFKNQISNYEAIRPMFEAFATNKYNATGVIQWMLNSAWPKIIWQLYDYYLVPNAAFYATKKSCAPLTVMFNYGDKNIYLSNDHFKTFENLTVTATVFDIESNVISKQQKVVTLPENSSLLAIEMPKLDLPVTYLLDLRLFDNTGQELANNFYWLSTKEETHKWEETYWLYTPGQEYADLRGINKMPKTQVDVSYEIVEQGEDFVANVSLHNPGKVIAFFTELRLVDKDTQFSIVPVFWSDNYITLLPGEKREIQVKISSHLAQKAKLEIVHKTWNTHFNIN